MTQLLNLHKLHPDILAFVRILSGVGPRYLSVRRLRSLCRLSTSQQIEELARSAAEFAQGTHLLDESLKAGIGQPA